MILLYLIIAFRKYGNRRFDGSPSLPYFTSSSLGIEEEPFSFYSDKYKLSGSRYYVKKDAYKGLIVFFHGVGAGRNAYLKEISLLAKEGYLVYAYDNLGCMQSEGASYVSLGHPPIDEEAFFSYLETDAKAKGLKRYAMGHSWGGYASLCALKEEYKIEKVISVAGFIRPTGIIKTNVKDLNNPYLRWLSKYAYRIAFGRKQDIDALTFLKETSKPVLYIQGSKDNIVPFNLNGQYLKKEVGNKGNIEFFFVEGSEHEPLFTRKAEEYTNSFIRRSSKEGADEKTEHMDIKKAREINPFVWKRVIDFLKE